MGLLRDFRERADDLREDLSVHGATIAGAVRSNTYAVALVALVSCVALVLGITALARTRG
jgi:hypothetical protein